jgi:uncharacterized membrane protein (DUF485 family)
MKEIRFILRELVVVAFTSAWWAALIFKNRPCGIAAAVASIIIIIAAIIYISDHWTDD